MSKFLVRKNHADPSAAAVEVADIPDLYGPVLPKNFGTKVEFVQWCAESSTTWCFYSAWEGEKSDQRVGRENQPKSLHGLIGDYDAHDLEQSVVERALEDSQKNGYPVAYVTRTYSGGIRLIWIFESPLPVYTADVAKGIARRAAKELKLGRLAPGFDDAAFLDPSKYYEKGRDWRAVNPAARIPAARTEAWAYDASTSAVFTKLGDDIPLEDIAAECRKRWPDRCPEVFEDGTKCLRFWDPAATNLNGAWIRKGGIQAFTGEGRFLPWREILGKEWVKKYEEARISSAVTGVYCEGAGYWKKDEAGLWKNLTTDQLRRHFRHSGLTDARKGDNVSEVEEALSYVERVRRVDGSGAFLYHDGDLVEQDGRRFLNRSHTRPRQPSQGVRHWGQDFKWIASLIDGLFDDHQREVFLSWLAHVYQGALKHEARQGHAIFIVGPTGSGKTLLSHEIISKLLGSRGEATSFLLGRDNFNAELLDKAVWSVDDAEIAADRQAHNAWTERVKKTVANPSMTVRGMYKEGATMPWSGRIVVTLNDDAIAMLPNAEANLLDKVMFFQVSDPGVVFEGCRKTIAEELPAFGAYLRDWVIPETLKDPRNNRFGLRSYQHQDLLDAARADTPSADLGYIIRKWAEEYFTFHQDKKEWEGTAQQLFSLLYEADSLAQLLRHTVRTPAYLGRGLSTLLKQGMPGLSNRKSGERLWKIVRPQGLKVAGKPGTKGSGRGAANGWAEGTVRAEAIEATAQS